MRARQHPNRFHTAGAGAAFVLLALWWAVRPVYIVTVGLLSLGAHSRRFAASRTSSGAP